MDELVEWLKAQLDEDAEIARKAASLCGCHPAAPVWAFGDESTDGRIVIADDPHPGMRRKLSRRWSGSYDGLFAAEHIALHDPARVLREVEAKRRIMAPLEGILYQVERMEERISEEWSAGDPIDRETSDGLLKLLALPYADRPGYREEWRP